MHILIVNINGLRFTEPLINDLTQQSKAYKLTFVDQGSTEKGTGELLAALEEYLVEVIRNKSNVDLNRIWNDFCEKSRDPYLCFLNNDVRIPYNFVADTERIFAKEPSVGCVLHATNHPDYQEATSLQYVILSDKITQGWAFTMRREAYTPIPDDFKMFGGDDWLFNHLYKRGWTVAMCLSSPITHHKAQSRKYYEGNRVQEMEALKKHGVERYTYLSPYTKQTPRRIHAA